MASYTSGAAPMCRNARIARYGPPMPNRAPSLRVSTTELFFDLVFVFAITRLTAEVATAPTWAGLLRAALPLAVLWWMYGGYAWLTNAVPPHPVPYRLLVFVGMGGFLVASLAIPKAFAGSGLVFGVAYIVVNLVHMALFTRAAEGATAWAALRLAPLNLLSALLVLIAGTTPRTASYALWTTAVAWQWVTPYLIPLPGFVIRPAHFVERHGLVILIALGESIVAVGIGISGRPVDALLVSAALLALAIAAALWWLYFDGDDERAERALDAAGVGRRPWLALYGFFYSFLPMLAGIILFAAGVQKAIVHADARMGSAGAWYLAAGVALYTGGEAVFRRVVGGGAVAFRSLLAATALATVPLGTRVAAAAEMAVLAALLVVGLTVESRLRRAPAAER
jgi:low temperature requirement protein LtrA